MARFKSSSRSYMDERAFPVRVLAEDKGGDWIVFSEAEAWCNEQVGRGQWAAHGAGNLRLHARAFYFRSTQDADRFVAAHPKIKLLDTTDRVSHLEAERNSRPHDGRHDAAHLSRGPKG